ncbi:MAG: DNA-binding domain-containing protein [Alphaproteobacteria bacterium]|nr:DNA-binding domain-containing protein [Alphaproteobacteria bacterium]
MPSLAKLQKALLHDIYTDSFESLTYLDERIPDIKGRLNIYKNNTRLNLVDTLKNIYPVTLQLVGDEFFKTMARHYIKQVPMEGGNRNAYGAGFSAFISSFKGADSLPYLSDMAKLEYAYFKMGLAEGREPLTHEGLQAALEQDGDVKIALNKHVCLVKIDFNVNDLWVLHQLDSADYSSFELSLNPFSILILRDASYMTWMKALDTGTAEFLEHIQSGKSFAESMQFAMENQSNLENLQIDFGYLMNHQSFIQLNGEKTND